MVRSKHFRRNLFLIIGAVGIALLVFAGIGYYDYYRKTHSGAEHPSSETITRNNGVSEKAITVDESGTYTVPDEQPRVIQIPSLNISGYVQRVGVGVDKAMATPSNINFAGWYVNNPVPGDAGLSIVNGHAGGRYADGIFRHINALKAGDSIKVQMGDLSWRQFSVVSSNVYPVADASSALFKDDISIDKELHLITCDGEFDDGTQTYSKRAIVVAKLVSGR